MPNPNTQLEASGNDPQVKYCVTAVIDLLGFSSHLEIGGNDLRTNIGQEAIKRLQILEDALRLMNDERSLCKDEYPREFYHTRINDALILTLDLPGFFTPSVGEAIKRGISPNEIEQFFDVDSIGTGEEFEQVYVARRLQESADLVRFVGLIARLHHYVNRKENSAFFPGAKTVVATGYRRTFLVNGTEDFLAANFGFSNAYLAEKDLHGPRLFLDDYIVELLSSNPFARNLLRFASYIQSSGSFDLFRENDESIRTTKTQPLAVTLFRKPFSFRELDSSIVAYIQLIPRLSPYLNGEKEPKAKSTFRSLFHAIKEGLGTTEVHDAIAPKFPVRLLNDIEFDIRILAELMESGSSVIAEEQLQRQRREYMVSAIDR